MPGTVLETAVKWWEKQVLPSLDFLANVFQVIPQIKISLQTVMRESQGRVSQDSFDLHLREGQDFNRHKRAREVEEKGRPRNHHVQRHGYRKVHELFGARKEGECGWENGRR